MKWIDKTFEQLTTRELYALLQLRSEVFVVEQRCDYQDLDDKDHHPAARHLLGYQDQALVAYLRLLPPGLSYSGMSSIGRVVTSPAIRNQGWGAPLMSEGVALCLQHWPQYNIKISAQSHLQHYYRRFGFLATGDEYLEDDIPHIAMVRDTTTSGPL